METNLLLDRDNINLNLQKISLHMDLVAHSDKILKILETQGQEIIITKD